MTPTTRETADHAELAACPFCGGAAKCETLGHGKSARTGVKCADVDCPGSMRLVGPDEDGVAFWNRRPREAALLSEIAALRGERDDLKRHRDRLAMTCQRRLDDWRSAQVQATQAERQRDELRKALEEIARATPTSTQSETAHDMAEWSHCRAVVALCASTSIANQGADQ